MEENKNKYTSSDEIATLLVKLYAEYKSHSDDDYDVEDEYARAVAVAIRMLVD